MSNTEFSRRSGVSEKTISLILNEKAPVSPENAIKFELVLGISREILNQMDSKYRLLKASEEVIDQYNNQIDWLKKFPIQQLKARNILPSSRDNKVLLDALLRFFGVAHESDWKEHYYNYLTCNFRKSNVFSGTYEHTMAWLRLAQIKATDINCNDYNEQGLRACLHNIRGLTRQSPEGFEKTLRHKLSDVGVALVFVPEFSKTHIFGATQWLDTNKAMIALSLRYKWEDQFWFSLYHEAAHLLLHGRKQIFIDETTGTPPEIKEKEEEANLFAANVLIPQNKYQEFINGRIFSYDSISNFSDEINISPGIIIGRLKHDGRLPYNTRLNKRVKRFAFNK